MKHIINIIPLICFLAVSPTLLLAQKNEGKSIEGIWQLTNPSRNNGNGKDSYGFVPKWKIYYPDGHFTIMSCNAKNESANISATGKYVFENDSVVLEKSIFPDKNEHEERIKIVFINKSLINIVHTANSNGGTWQELWKRVTSETDNSVSPYIQNKENGVKPSCDLNGVYFTADKMPVYSKGSERDMMLYIAKSLVYPEDAQQKGLQGITIVRFVVNEKGKPENLQVIRSSYPILDKEAMRVIETLAFKPGTNNGKKVKVYMNIPVDFKLK